MSETGWRPWLPEAIAALMVLAIGFTEAVLFWAMTGGHLAGFAQALVIAVAVGMCRRAPGAALGLVWTLGLIHVLFGAPIMLIEFALTAVFFGGARWGRLPTVVISALSVPLAVVVAFVVHERRIISLHLLLGGSKLGDIMREQPTLRLALSLIGLLIVATPWPTGLVMRFLERASTSRVAMLAAEEAAAGAWRETEHAREIAHLRDQQTRLARDVHDVVGHSLAVILAQAESGQYLDEPAKLKKTLQTIATSARSSLQDVRQVLSSTQDTTMVRGDTDRFDSLIAGVRGSGHEIVATELGTPRQLPPEAAAVAYRVFQEMLTNAIKHGRRDHPIVAERHWPAAQPAGGFTDTLRIEVTNMTESSDHAGAGRGLDGMRRRLEAIGGHLDVRRREQPAGISFSVTAFVPVRGGA
ncbi:sensor histidine kinase [Allorhizocola rhizosphaerae]|uniref:sensor histidine kinase n=1 Tax=Allorhizocola rhizosphaerae TaxID=1872709 RepID=UPI000E3DF03F|nr:histidine kinase [Allorhizocola rhizosphaerae]